MNDRFGFTNILQRLTCLGFVNPYWCMTCTTFNALREAEGKKSLSLPLQPQSV